MKTILAVLALLLFVPVADAWGNRQFVRSSGGVLIVNNNNNAMVQQAPVNVRVEQRRGLFGRRREVINVQSGFGFGANVQTQRFGARGRLRFQSNTFVP